MVSEEEHEALYTGIEAQRDPEFLSEADEIKDHSEEEEYDRLHNVSLVE